MVAVNHVIFVVLACVAPFVCGQDDPYGQAGVFDLYAFARTWTPEFCCENSTSAECTSLSPDSYAQTNFALHGLWPQYASTQGGDHDWPQFCGGGNETFFDIVSTIVPAVNSEFQPAWSTYAPGYAYGGLNTHEWQRHGTCYSSAVTSSVTTGSLAAVQMRYFTNQMNLMKASTTPDIVQEAQNTGRYISYEDLSAAFGGANNVALSCSYRDGRQWLSGVLQCYAKDSLGNPTEQVPCPDNVISSSYDNNCVTDYVNRIYVADAMC
jgi:ribonuclease T2